MKNEVTPFNYNGHNLSTITDEQGEIWFIAKDVCSVLDHSNVSAALANLDEDERSKFKLGRQGEVNAINESGLYSLILNSRKPEARPFKKWVTSEVLPSIRKTGSYTADKKRDTTSLDNLRQANALKIVEETASRICQRFPHLAAISQQTIYASIINPIAGSNVIPLPVLTEKHLSAGEVGLLLGVSANAIGRLANKHEIKTDEHGMFVLDKSRSSTKQVETFHYNRNGVDKLRELLSHDKEAA